MKIAIYSRKSKLTDRGESIQNQIEMCKNYIFANFKVSESDVIIYEDEGFSGGNTDRPEFQKLMKDITKKKFSTVVVYRLDRISRNVLDFATIIEDLSKYSVSFVSITEHFDTTTPMGRAMVNIAAVFAQLERETIAERIRDNMSRLARTGRYLGSTPPTGFVSEKIEYMDPSGNKKKMHKLAPVLDEIKFIELIYEKYLEFEGLTKVETWLMQNRYKNRNGNYLGTSELRRLLTNPVYVRADENVYDYYKSIGTEIVNTREEFNSINGMLAYGRHDRNNGVFDPTKWTVVIAKHEGIISAESWLMVQNLLEKNKDKAPRAGTSKHGLLTSKIKCSHCGGTMTLMYGKVNDRHYYRCRNKVKSRKTLCDVKNITGQDADDEIFNYLKELGQDRDRITKVLQVRNKKLAINEDDLELEEIRIKKAIKEKEFEIKNLTTQLRKNENSIAAKYIISDIESIDKEFQELKKVLSVIEEQKNQINDYKLDEELSVNALLDFGKSADSLSFEDKRKFVDRIIETIFWNGDSLEVVFR